MLQTERPDDYAERRNSTNRRFVRPPERRAVVTCSVGFYGPAASASVERGRQATTVTEPDLHSLQAE